VGVPCLSSQSGREPTERWPTTEAELANDGREHHTEDEVARDTEVGKGEGTTLLVWTVTWTAKPERLTQEAVLGMSEEEFADETRRIQEEVRERREQFANQDNDIQLPVQTPDELAERIQYKLRTSENL